MKEAQIVIEEWRQHYNTVRPHSSLGYRPPAAKAVLPADRRSAPPGLQTNQPLQNNNQTVT